MKNFSCFLVAFFTTSSVLYADTHSAAAEEERVAITTGSLRTPILPNPQAPVVPGTRIMDICASNTQKKLGTLSRHGKVEFNSATEKTYDPNCHLPLIRTDGRLSTFQKVKARAGSTCASLPGEWNIGFLTTKLAELRWGTKREWVDPSCLEGWVRENPPLKVGKMVTMICPDKGPAPSLWKIEKLFLPNGEVTLRQGTNGKLSVPSKCVEVQTHTSGDFTSGEKVLVDITECEVPKEAEKASHFRIEFLTDSYARLTTPFTTLSAPQQHFFVPVTCLTKFH